MFLQILTFFVENFLKTTNMYRFTYISLCSVLLVSSTGYTTNLCKYKRIKMLSTDAAANL